MDFVKRPVAVLTLTAFISFCIMANAFVQVSVYLPIVFAVFSILFLSASFLDGIKRKTSLLLRYFFLITAGFFFAAVLIILSFSGKEVRYVGCEAEKTAVIRDVIWENDNSCCYKAEILTEDENFFVALECFERFEIKSAVRGMIAFSALESGDTFDEKRYYMSKGMVLKGEVFEAKVIGKAKGDLLDFFDNINGTLSRRLKSSMTEEAAALADAVVLGNKGELSREIKRNFSKIGISHLIAISGMHISYITAAFFGVTRKLRSGRRASNILCIFLMLFYMGITGFSASVTRAAILCCLLCAVSLFGICHDGITALGICGLGMVCVCPYFAFDVGMQLSFAAYLGCLGALRLIKRFERLFEKQSHSHKSSEDGAVSKFFRKTAVYLRSTFIMTVTVMLFTLPVLWIYYDNISVAALVTNIIFIPLFSIVMYAGAGTMLLSSIPIVGEGIALVSQKIIDLALDLSGWLAELDIPMVSLRYAFSPFLIGLLTLFCILFVCDKKRLSSIYAACLAITVGIYGVGILCYNAEHRDVIVASRIDGKYGDGIVIAAEGETYLCDFSSGSLSEAAGALNCAAALCEEDIDNIILTEISEGHFDLVSRLCETSYVERVYIPFENVYKKENLKKNIIEYLDEKGIECIEYSIENSEKLSFPFRMIYVSEEDIALLINGDENGFLYLTGNTERYSRAAKLIENEENFRVLIGKTSKKTDVQDIERADLLFGDAEVFVVAKAETKDSFDKSFGINFLSPDESFSCSVSTGGK